MTRRVLVVAVAALLLLHGAPAVRARTAQDEPAIRALLERLEQVVRDGEAPAYLALLTSSADRSRATDFSRSEILPGATRVVIRERSRAPVAEAQPESGYRIVMDTFVEFRDRARIATWHLDVRKSGDDVWGIVNQARLSTVNDLYRLSVNPSKQFLGRDFTIKAEDLDLTLADGSVFTVETNRGITALVLIGRGVMRFHPTPQVEKDQVRIFAGSETLDAPFEAAFVRVGNLEAHADMSRLTARAVDPRDLRRAEDVFRTESAKTFSIGLGDLASGNWTTLPGASDIVAEVQTRRYGTLTYSRSAEADEDISVFDRARQKNIAVYSSMDRLAERGRFDDEDARTVYDVLNYEIDLSFDPVRRWFDSRARMRLKIRSQATTQLTLRLADTLAVESVTSDEFGPLFSVRVSNQNTLLVNLPVALRQDENITLTIEYSGRVGGQAGEWEALPFTQRDIDALQGTANVVTPVSARPNTIYLYGNRSYWYPRATVFDYATATLRIWVPAAFDCVGSGEPTPESPILNDIDPAGPRKLYVFNAGRPIRYLSFLVTQLTPIERATVAFSENQEDGTGPFRGPSMGGAVYNTLDLHVVAHPRAATKARPLVTQAVDIAQFYRSIVGDTPYSSLTLALVEGTSTGGHSPAYVAAIRKQTASAPRPFRNDPAAVDAYPEFFPAHEIAHQWWGQAVGWKTYHDQWLSEGFAQYFAALYTHRQRGDEAFKVILRQMRRWALEESDQGPLSLGYRLGHVRDDGRVFRALVYNKGAAVLHMLRQLIGDEAFFLGVRRFYANWRFQKAGTDDLRHAMETEAGRSLEQFFERWVYSAALPQLKFTYRVENAPTPAEGRDVVLRVDQTGDLFDVPVTVLLQFSDAPTAEVVIPVTARTTEVRVPLGGVLRRVDISKDDGTLADVQKN